MIDLCQWRARIGSWNSTRHWRQPSACTSTGYTYCGTNGGSNASQVKTRPILSFFCLLILLLISGDVELNPGPTLTDKPTKDELIELLSSSTFTAGTWEQFVCCLPNMTQDIITGIKERGSIEVDTMSAVAQHCLDNNPDITWRNIIDALLDANENHLCSHILKEASGARKTVKKVFVEHYYNLSCVITNSIRPIADRLYSNNLIGLDVKNDPSMEKIEGQFYVAVSLCEEDAILLKIKCQRFLKCIAEEKGPAEEVAIALARDWEHEVFKCNHLVFPVHQEMTKKSNIVVPENIAMELKSLQKEINSLIVDIRKFYSVSKKHDLFEIAMKVEEFIADKEVCLAHENSNIHEIFRKMKPHYNLLEIELIKDLILDFPIDATLQSRFDKYSAKLDSFLCSVKIKELTTSINAALQHEETENHCCKMVIKLSGTWLNQSIANFHKLMEYFFLDKAKNFTYEKILDGSIIIYLVISSNKIALILIDMACTKVQFMHHFGILQLIIHNETIINRNEDVNFKFEESLHDAIRNFHNHMEYQNVVLFLLQLEIDIHYENEHGYTALMLAICYDHHQVVELLLSKDLEIIQVQKVSSSKQITLTYSSSMPDLHHNSALFFDITFPVRSHSLPFILVPQISENNLKSPQLLEEEANLTAMHDYITLALPESENNPFSRRTSALVCGKLSLKVETVESSEASLITCIKDISFLKSLLPIIDNLSQSNGSRSSVPLSFMSLPDDDILMSAATHKSYSTTDIPHFKSSEALSDASTVSCPADFLSDKILKIKEFHVSDLDVSSRLALSRL